MLYLVKQISRLTWISALPWFEDRIERGDDRRRDSLGLRAADGGALQRFDFYPFALLEIDQQRRPGRGWDVVHVVLESVEAVCGNGHPLGLGDCGDLARGGVE